MIFCANVLIADMMYGVLRSCEAVQVRVVDAVLA